MSQVTLTELDFNTIKDSIKNYLSSQSEFTDYDFDGAGLNILLDVLAYNTQQNAFLTHFLANESFLETAAKRNSVVSLAKALGYTPSSTKASTATINLSIVPDISYTDSTLTLPGNSGFNTTVNGQAYLFYPVDDIVATLETRDGVTGFFYDNLSIKEGIFVRNSFIVDLNTTSGPFIIPNPNIDTNTLTVRVQTSGTQSFSEAYTLSSTILNTTSTSKIYYLEENHDGLYALSFGDGVFGKKLEPGNIVIIDYLSTNGKITNGAKTFSYSFIVTGGGEVKSHTVLSQASGGQDRETIASIKKNAPRYNQTKNRAVTVADYESLISNSNSAIRSVSVWGGEQNDPPIYGKVFVSLQPVAGSIITQDIKNNIMANIIDKKAPIALSTEFVDPEYLYVGFTIKITFDNRRTNQTRGQIESSAATLVTDFFNSNLNKLNKNFYYSKLHNVISASSQAITSVTIKPKLQKRILADTSVLFNNLSVFFNNKLQPREIDSIWFNSLIGDVLTKVKLADVPNRGVVAPDYTGSGKLYLQKEDGTLIKEIGTIDYDLGKLVMTNVNVSSYYGGETMLRINAGLHDNVNDILTDSLIRTTNISTSAIIAKPSKNLILALDETARNSISNSRKGLDITAIARIED